MQGSRTISFLFFLTLSLLSAAHAGNVVVWGDNSLGETNLPPNLDNVVAISAGGFHSLALKADGTVAAWGDNSLNQSTVPPGLSNVIGIAAGENHSCALKQDGSVAQWGDIGVLPVDLDPTNIIAIAAGGFHTLGLKPDGTVIGWGNNYYGQCTPPSGLSNVIAIAAGEYHSVALRSNGTVITWGDDRFTQCSGAIVTNASAIAAATYHTLAITKDGSVVCFGDNSCGQTNAPPELVTATSLAGGSCFSLAAKSDGTIAAWGNAGSIPILSDVLAVAAGRAHGLALLGTRSAALSIRTQNGSANLQWNDTSFQLQTTTNFLNPASWQNVPTTTNAYVTNTADKARYFRLIKN